MEAFQRCWPCKWLATGLTLVFACGCAVGPPAYTANSPVPVVPATGASPESTDHSQAVVPVAAQVSTKPPSGPLSLEQLLALTLENNPDLASARARADSARGRLIQAGLYPNPNVGWEADQVGDNQNGAGEQGPFVEQEIVTGGKLRLAQEAAAHGVTAADWQAISRWFEAVIRVRSAYYDLLAAQRESRDAEDIVREYDALIEKADPQAKKGVVLTADVLRFQVEQRQSRNRLGAARQREQAARRLLAAAVGVPDLPAPLVEQKLETTPPAFEWEPLRAAVLSRHSEVQEAQATVFQAEAEARLTVAQVAPNVRVRVRPFYDYPGEDTKVLLEAGVALPVFNRNQGNIFSAQADVARAAAQARDVQVRLCERLAGAMQRYEDARRQAALLTEILRDARQALEQLRELYQVKGERFLDLLDAQRSVAEARLDYVEALGELWKAVAEIEGLLQRETPPLPLPSGHCP